ncbi:hypothetical protein SLS62_005910 [Diatrype stigma]|uniref:Six-bladed beta-propeller-like protein n=1 Tax=Diatrype stigma TaxID=117547 RepID=A0AAN9YPF4_9PEZI
MIEDDSISEIVLLTQLPTDSWFQGTALRPDGRVLASRLDLPELYLFNPKDPESEPVLLHTFPEASGLVDVCPLKGCHDEFAVISGVFDIPNATFEKPTIWRVKLSPKDDVPPTVSCIGEVAGAGFVAGMIAATEKTLLIADSSNYCIWRVDIATAKSSVLSKGESMVALSEEEPYGINAVCITDRFAYFGNESTGCLGRVPVKFGPDGSDDGWDIHATGPAQVVSDEIPHSDGLTLTKDGNVAYSANYVNGELRRIDIDDATGKGTTTMLMDNLVTPASLQLVYDDNTSGKAKMLCLCLGEIDISWVRDDGDGSWSDIANINESVTVTVTTEVVETS